MLTDRIFRSSDKASFQSVFIALAEQTILHANPDSDITPRGLTAFRNTDFFLA